MIEDILAIGDKIELKLLDQTGRVMKGKMLLVSQLIDFIDGDVISIATPIIYGKVIFLVKGSHYSLCFYSNKNLYECNCEVIGHYKDKNLDIVHVKLQSDLEKFQRRQYYRLECVIESKYRVITEDEIKLEEKSKDETISETLKFKINEKLDEIKSAWIPGTVTDISGGGARLNSNKLIEAGEKVLVQFDLSYRDDCKRLELPSCVIASNHIENRVGQYEHRVQFVNIGKREREDIIKYIFEQDRRRRKYDRI